MSKADPSIFKAYDIRGTYPDQVNTDLAYRLGRAVVTMLKPKQVAVAWDMRESSPELFRSLAKGIMDQGADVVSLGLVPTPTLYITVGAKGYDAGISLTASHNPGEYNGFKIVRKGAVPVGGSSGMAELKDLVIKNSWSDPASTGKTDKYGSAIKDHVSRVLDQVSLDDASGLKIAIDAGNGMGPLIFDPLLEKLGIEPIKLFWELDGSFPNHEANPLKTETLRDLQDLVKKEKADIGIASDGDSDRVGFVDEKGEFIPGDIITALLASEVLGDKPGSTVLYDLRSSWIVKEVIEENGGRAIETRVGHSLIKEHMRKENAVFAGEVSMHFYFQDNYYCESPLVAVLMILRLIKREGKKLSEIIKPLWKYAKGDEINFEVEDKEKAIKKLEDRYGKEGRVSRLDGIKIEFADWWFNVRPSNTEPLLRLNMEAKSQEVLEQKLAEIKEVIQTPLSF